MALAFSNVQDIVRLTGGIRIGKANITLETSYPTTGTAGIVQGLGLGTLLAIVPLKSLGFDFDYDIATDKLKVYQQPAAAAAGPSPEVPNTTNLSANVLPILYIGT